MSVTYGLDPKSKRISVYYTESSTIYEGMPVCYEFDATTNWLGVDGSKIDFTTTASTASLESTSTAEGYQNEGKFIRVEDPDDDNIHAFAGVVAGGDHVGQAGPRAIDIYVPNGAIVPVRTDQACTCGTTVLAVHTAEQHLTGPYSTAGRPVAIAAETKDNSSAAAIVLAKLDPNLFLYQMADATNLNIDDQDTGNSMTVNKIKITTAQATGDCTALSISLTSTAQTAGSATALSASSTTVSPANTSGVYFGLTNTGTGAAGFHVLQVRGNAYGTAIAGDINGIYSQITMRAGAALSSGTVCGSFSKVHVLTGGGTNAGNIVAGRFSLGLDSAVTGKTAMFAFDTTTIIAKEVDYLFITSAAGPKEDIGYTGNTTHTSAATSKVGAIPVYFGHAAAVRYIYVYSDAGA